MKKTKWTIIITYCKRDFFDYGNSVTQEISAFYKHPLPSFAFFLIKKNKKSQKGILEEAVFVKRQKNRWGLLGCEFYSPPKNEHMCCSQGDGGQR